MKAQRIYFLLKLSNTAIVSIWSFLITYSMIHTIGVTGYAFLAGLFAISALVLQTDLGLAAVLFARLRKTFLTGEGDLAEDRSIFSALFVCYFGVALVATATVAAFILGTAAGPESVRGAAVLIFGGIVLTLPWLPVRAALNAHDRYIASETIEFCRRGVMLLAAAALLIGLPVWAYGLVVLSSWVVVYGVAAVLVAGCGMSLLERSFLAGARALMRTELARVRAAVRFAGSEFLIYIFPYYCIPFLFGSPTILVAFDTYYKVTRFAASAYLVGSETFLPAQTRAYYAHDHEQLRRLTARILAIGAVPAIGGIAVVALFGHEVFAILLSHGDVVSPTLRAVICAMFVLMLLQATCGTFLVGIGLLQPLANRANLVLAGMALLVAATWAFSLSFDAMMIGYVAIFAGGVVSYVLLLRRLFYRPAPRAPGAAAP